MTEHVHEWIPRALDWDHIDGVCCNVRGCGAQMDNEEMNARLNENETLKADKRLLMHVVHGRAMASSLPKHLKEEACP